MRYRLAAVVAGALLLAACSSGSDSGSTTTGVAAPTSSTSKASQTSTSSTLVGTPEERFVFMMRALASDVPESTWVDFFDDEEIAEYGKARCSAIDDGATFAELADDATDTAAEFNLTEADLTLAIQSIMVATLSLCEEHFDAYLEWFESGAPSATVPPVYSVQEPGYWIDTAPVQDGDVYGGFCSGYRMALIQMTISAQEAPDNFYPVPDPRTATCPDIAPDSSTVEQAFCDGWTSNTIFGTVALRDSPDIEAVIDVLFGACMGANFAMNPDTTQAYEFPIYEHRLFELGLICYPPDSYYWTRHPEIPPRDPWVAMCES